MKNAIFLKKQGLIYNVTLELEKWFRGSWVRLRFFRRRRLPDNGIARQFLRGLPALAAAHCNRAKDAVETAPDGRDYFLRSAHIGF